MSNCTRVTLAAFSRLAMKEEDALPIEHLVLLQNGIAMKESRLKALRAKLDTLLTRRYGATARNLRGAAGETAEIVTLVEGDFLVTVGLAQEVKWDQTKLAKLAEVIFHDWQRDPEDYITISYTVQEQVYLAARGELRTHLDDARSVGAGTPGFDITIARASTRRAGKVGAA